MYQICVHVCLQLNLFQQGELLVTHQLSHSLMNLLVPPPLQPVGQEGLHHLIEDLRGDKQGGQTLKVHRETKYKITSI